jgi:hypothetical protein
MYYYFMQLRLLTEHVKVKGRPSGSGQAPATAAQHVPPPAAAPVTPAPQAAPVPAPVAAPMAAPVPAAAPLPNTPEEARQMFTQLISRLGGKEGPAQLDAVSHHTSSLFAFAAFFPCIMMQTESVCSGSQLFQHALGWSTCTYCRHSVHC